VIDHYWFKDGVSIASFVQTTTDVITDTTEYKLVVANRLFAQCRDTATAIVIPKFSPAIVVTPTAPTCDEDNGMIELAITDNPNYTTVEVSTDGGLTYPISFADNSGSFTITDLAEGTYDIYARWGNDDCPKDFGSVTLTDVSAVPTVSLESSVNGAANASVDTAFVEIGDMLDLTSNTGGAAGGFYSWTADNGTILTATTPTLQLSNSIQFSDIGTYYSNFVSADGCSTQDSVVVIIDNANKITGTVFFDLDQDGTIDPTTDFGQAGVTVYIYDDVNGDDIVGPGDILLDSVTTIIGGTYEFEFPFSGGVENFAVTTDQGDYPSDAFTTTDDDEEATFTTGDNIDPSNDFGFSIGDCSASAGNVIEESGSDNPLNVMGDVDGSTTGLPGAGTSVTVDLYNYLPVNYPVDVNFASASSGSNAVLQISESEDGITFSSTGFVFSNSSTINSSSVNTSNDSTRFIKIDNITTVGALIDAVGYDCGMGVEPVPVEWLSFEATYEEAQSVMLEWSTASEENNDYFTIERSTDGVNFDEIVDVVEGSGTTQEITEYNYMDRNAHIGVNYYRIKQTDYNGDFDFSEVRVVIINGEHSLTVYPNPARGSATVLLPEGSGSDIVTVTDISGNVIYTQEVTNKNVTKVQLEINEIRSGIYFVKYGKHYTKLQILN